MNGGWGWWLIQLLVPLIIIGFLVIMEIGHIIGYLPMEK